MDDPRERRIDSSVIKPYELTQFGSYNDEGRRTMLNAPEVVKLVSELRGHGQDKLIKAIHDTYGPQSPVPIDPSRAQAAEEQARAIQKRAAELKLLADRKDDGIVGEIMASLKTFDEGTRESTLQLIASQIGVHELEPPVAAGEAGEAPEGSLESGAGQAPA